MYIPAFWCGVIAVILAEIAVIIGWTVIYTLTKRNNK